MQFSVSLQFRISLRKAGNINATLICVTRCCFFSIINAYTFACINQQLALRQQLCHCLHTYSYVCMFVWVCVYIYIYIHSRSNYCYFSILSMTIFLAIILAVAAVLGFGASDRVEPVVKRVICNYTPGNKMHTWSIQKFQRRSVACVRGNCGI